MVNTNHCLPDEKYSQKHVYIVYFHVCKFWRGEKKDENTANAALKLMTYGTLYLLVANHKF